MSIHEKKITLPVAIIICMSLVAASFPVATPLIADAAVADWQKGVSILSRYPDDFRSDGFRQSVRNAQVMGANYVALIIPYLQNDTGSTDIGNSPNTPSDETLADAIDYIHSLGMKVALKPHLEVRNGTWRALILANDRDTWYARYGALLNHLGDIGKAHNVEEIVVGTELIGMASSYANSDNTQRWVSMINNLRARYPGLLTYSANFGSGSAYVTEYQYIQFWSSLDYIGISAYFTLSSDSKNPVGAMKASWSSIDTREISKVQAKYGKPVLFSEIGYRSVDGAHSAPWDYNKSGNYNPQEQSNLYQALFEYWGSRPYMSGIMIWDWSSDPNYGGEGNLDYTPHNKPAENLIRQYFGQGGSTTTPPTGTTTPPTGDWSSSATSSKGFRVGEAGTFNVSVSNAGEASDVIVDVEIYDSANSRTFQKFFEHQTISASTPATYSINWTPTVAGDYTLKIGTFRNDWGKTYYWSDSALAFGVAAPGQNPPPVENPGGTYTTDIWWPTDGTTISGTQPFKAMLQGKPVSEYRMYWQVDGSNLGEMQNSDQDYPHKESMVNVTNWSWRGAGPYNINFVSKDLQGNIISQKSVNIYIAQ